jgi:hypothetical protein
VTNTFIEERLDGIRQILMGVHNAGRSLTTPSKGNEREAFVDHLLSQVLPRSYRLGSGEATDQYGNKSGQLDVVVEYPFVPSLSIITPDSPRLYLAEGIVAAIEVKSNLGKQWSQVESSAKKLLPVKRNYTYREGISMGPRAIEKIPLYVVGYTGCSSLETVRNYVDETNGIYGVLVIDEGHFFGKCPYLDHVGKQKELECEAESTSMALWSFITCIHYASSMITSVTKNTPIRYGAGHRIRYKDPEDSSTDTLLSS